MNFGLLLTRPAVVFTALFCNLSFTDPTLVQEKHEKINAPVHTRLDMHFDYSKRYLYGKEWITIMPFARSTDSLRLDAKMDIKSLSLMKNRKNIPLKYTHDGHSLAIQLDRKYQPAESYMVYIDCITKPDELKLKAGQVILNDKGLFFINPDSAVTLPVWPQISNLT